MIHLGDNLVVIDGLLTRKSEQTAACIRKCTNALRKFKDAWLSRFGGIMLLEKLPPKGSLIVLVDAEKSPRRWAAVNTVGVVAPGALRSRVPWYDAKKNVLFFQMGPPNVPPY